MGSRSKKLKVHVAKMSKNAKNLVIEPHLVGETGRQLGSLIEFDSTNSNSLISLNASFFQGGTNLPVGITVLDKEILQLRKYKKWSSIVFTDKGVSLTEVDVKAFIEFGSSSVQIDRFNYRTDTTQIVAYNRFYNDIFPKISDDEIDSLYIKYLIDNNYNSIVGDDTEELISFEKFKEIYTNSIDFDSSHSFNYYKAIPLDGVGLSEKRKYRVKSVESLPVDLTKGEILIESKIKFPLFENDIISINTKMNIDNDSIKHIISTTPIIMKKGKVFVNSNYEGATSRRFNSHHLSRSAFGYNEDYYYIVAIEPNQGRSIKGATLLELAWVMDTLGATDAINLDGGGSTSFVINKQNLAFPYSPNYNRKVSTGISIFKKTKSK
jgi:exopolysaccharide biosynthesis protein